MEENRGRPTAMTESVILKLEEGFLMSLSDREACLYSGIAPSTLYEYCKENPDFSERKELLKEQVKIRAKKNITEAISNGDKPLSQWWLERKGKDEFSAKSEVEHSGAIIVERVNYADQDKDTPPIPTEGVSTPTS